MKKVIVVAEGPTEEKFVRRVLNPHFSQLGIYLDAQQWITNRKLGTTGGGKSFDLIENHIQRLMSRYRNDKEIFISIMIDLYAFPKQGNTIYDNEVSKITNSRDKVLLLEKKMAARFNYKNFIPYVQLHEYETLLFSETDKLKGFYTDKLKEIDQLLVEINGKNPEEINETPDGAPSKRIIKYLPSYQKQKTTAGVISAESIGLPRLRAACPHFDDWLTRLELL
jgi:hypothetical protein